MDIQTLLVWTARLACPLAIGVMLWFMFRQTSAAPDPSAAQHLVDLQQRRGAPERQIQVLEEHDSQDIAVADPASPNAL